jgi:aspartyl-tRNA(Asn)/glutamyl-tRNA(Gln) amidotransferase subunit B
MGLSEYNADVLVSKGAAVYEYFETLLGLGVEAKVAANWVINDVLCHAVGRIKELADLPIAPAPLAELIAMVKGNKLNLNDAREKVLPAMIETKKSAGVLASELGLEVVADLSAIESLCEEVLRDMAKAAADYRAGNKKSIGALIGQVQKRSKGKFPPALVNEVMTKKLES